MVTLALMLATLQLAGDTVRLDVSAAFERALEVSPDITAAELRAEAALDWALQARAFPNPGLTLNAENLGRQEALTGLGGFDGTEGQAVVTAQLPFGWERTGRTGVATALAAENQAGARRVQYDAAVQTLAAIGDLLRDETLASSAREEDATLARFAEVLGLQAQEGRASTGDAARAELARGLAATGLARREAALAASMTDLARRLGMGPEEWVVLDAPKCRGVPGPTTAVSLDPASPEIEGASARLEGAESAVTLARGMGLPDLLPQIGLRRAGGLNALYIGVSTTLPLFDRGSDRVSAASAEHRAAAAELSAVRTSLAARGVGAARALAALEQAGRSFTPTWFSALDRTVTAAQTRYDLGEGTLLELLDSRRARLQALDDYAVWQSEWWQARTTVARLEGRSVDATLLCTDPFVEIR